MASPVGHALAGYAVYRFAAASSPGPRRHQLALLSIFAAIAPDLDFLPGLLMGTPALYHQEITHSLGAALIISLAIALAFSLRGWSFVTIFSVCFVAYLSHLIIDFFGPDKRWPYGQPLFWPLSEEHFISPRPVFWGMRHAHATSASTLEWIGGILDPHNLGAVAIEIALIMPFVLLAGLYRKALQGWWSIR